MYTYTKNKRSSAIPKILTKLSNSQFNKLWIFVLKPGPQDTLLLSPEGYKLSEKV